MGREVAQFKFVDKDDSFATKRPTYRQKKPNSHEKCHQFTDMLHVGGVQENPAPTWLRERIVHLRCNVAACHILCVCVGGGE